MKYEKKQIQEFLNLSYEERLEWLEEAQMFVFEAYEKNPFLKKANEMYRTKKM